MVPGATVNISGVAVVKNGPNIENAKKFADFLLTPDTQKVFAEANYEHPVLEGVATAEGVKPLVDVKRNPVKLGEFGQHWDKSVLLIDKIGLVLK